MTDSVCEESKSRGRGGVGVRWEGVGWGGLGRVEGVGEAGGQKDGEVRRGVYHLHT